MTTAADWTASTGDVWAAEWRRTDRSFADLSIRLDAAIVAVAPQRGQAVDIGAGAGTTAAALARVRPNMSVLGIDLSQALVTTARERHGAMTNLRFTQADAMTAIGEVAPVDLFVSRHGVMFFDDPLTAFTMMRRAAAPGAALVFSCFAPRADNGWCGVLDSVIGPQAPPTGYAPGPFAFADPLFVGDVLAHAGWSGAVPMPVHYRYVAGEGESDTKAVDDAVSFFSRIGPAAPLLAADIPSERIALADRLRRALSPYCRDGAVVLGASAWIWTARAGEAA